MRRERREISAADPGVLTLSVAVRGRALVVMFHRDLLPLSTSRVAPLLGPRIPGGSGPGAALLPMLGALAPHDLFVPDAVLGLVSACLVDDAAPPAQDEDARHTTYRRVLALIDAHLAEDLDVVGLAGTHHVSVRYLQKLFADHGGTVSSRVRQRRLERARLEPSDRALARARAPARSRPADIGAGRAASGLEEPQGPSRAAGTTAMPSRRR